MFQIGGIIFVFVTVFGGYVLAGGKFDVILHALPYEGTQILGAAIGALLIASSVPALKAVGGSFGKIMGGSKWKQKDYTDLLTLLFVLTKTMKSKGMIALEQHIEKPEESTIFKNYPRIIHDHFAIDFICDTIRMMTMSLEDPHQVETAMEKQLEKHHHEALSAANSWQSMADGMPALGIVAAVLGVIKTMGSITEPPEILGEMIGGALVGTFFGVFVAYGFFAPFASRLKATAEEESQFYHVIRDVLVAHLHGNAAQVSVEIGRGSVPSHFQPSFATLEEALNAAPQA
ncbi:MAG: flagellar motor stator protein MotA [Alphaproteobacteria bacterium]|nr:flagellar motor stator protein MotA [Alphaproteobacteria bacterium]